MHERSESATELDSYAIRLVKPGGGVMILSENEEDCLRKLRIGYFKELTALREQLTRLQSEHQKVTLGSNELECREQFYSSFEVYFYGVQDGLYEPELLEAMRESVRQTARHLIRQNFDLRKRLVDAGIEVPGFPTITSPQPPDLSELANKSDRDLTFHIFSSCILSKPLASDYCIQIQPNLTDFGQNCDTLELADRPQQTCPPILSLESRIIWANEGLVTRTVTREHYEQSSFLHIQTEQHIYLDTSVNTDPEPVVLRTESECQTFVAPRISIACSCEYDTKHAETQTKPLTPILNEPSTSSTDLTEPDRDLIGEYVSKFRKSFIFHLHSNEIEPLNKLLTESAFIDKSYLDATASSGESSESEFEYSGDGGHHKFKRQVLKLKAEVADLEGKLAIQAKRLNRALNFIDTVKKDKCDVAGKAAESLAKMKHIRNTVRKLRRNLRSRERQVRVLTNSLKWERHRYRSVEQNTVNKDQQSSIIESELIEEDFEYSIFQSARSAAKIKTFSFEPITEHSAEISATQRSLGPDRQQELLRQRHQLRLGQLHNLKPLVDHF